MQLDEFRKLLLARQAEDAPDIQHNNLALVRLDRLGEADILYDLQLNTRSAVGRLLFITSIRLAGVGAGADEQYADTQAENSTGSKRTGWHHSFPRVQERAGLGGRTAS